MAVADNDDAGWWNALQQGRLTVAWCHECDRSWLRASPTCPRCSSAQWELRDASTVGTIYSWVTVHRALDPSFESEVPYTIAVIELEGGARLNVRLEPNGREPAPGETVEVSLLQENNSVVPIGHLQPVPDVELVR